MIQNFNFLLQIFWDKWVQVITQEIHFCETYRSFEILSQMTHPNNTNPMQCDLFRLVQRGTFWNHLSKRFEGCIDIEDGRQKLTRNWTVQISSHLKIRCICRHVILNFFDKLSQGTPVFISSSMKSTITITSSTACHCMMRIIACIK